MWTGRQAKQNGLVDELGGLDRAIALAEAAREDSGRQRRRDRRLSAAEELLRAAVGAAQRIGRASRSAFGAWLTANLSKGEIEVLRTMRGPLAMFRRGEPLALMPFTFLR